MPFGILNFGSFVPPKRDKNPEDKAKALGILERARPSRHDDTLTLATVAALRALEGFDPNDVQALFLGTETPLYAVKPTSVMLGSALGVSPFSQSVDMEFACKSGLIALDVLHSYMEKREGLALSVSADVAEGHPGDPLFYSAGGGAAAFLLGHAKKPLATLNGSLSYNTDRADFWRVHGEKTPRHAGRFSSDSYLHHLETVILAYLKKNNLKLEDYDHVVLHMPNAKLPLRLAKKLGVNQAQLEAGFVVPNMGNAYAAMVPIGFCSVLSKAKAGQRVLLASYGSGAGAISMGFSIN